MIERWIVGRITQGWSYEIIRGWGSVDRVKVCIQTSCIPPGTWAHIWMAKESRTVSFGSLF